MTASAARESEETDSSPEEILYKRLQTFGKRQFEHIDPEQFKSNSANLTATISFLVGSIHALAEHIDLQDYDHMPILQRYVMAKFKMPRPNARGIIESNDRLYKKYTYLENAYNEGREAAAAWCQDENAPAMSLNTFLQQYNDVTMSDLAKEGVREESSEQETESDPVPETTPDTTVKPDQAPSRSVRPVFLFWFAAVLVLAVMNFVLIRLLLF